MKSELALPDFSRSSFTAKSTSIDLTDNGGTLAIRLWFPSLIRMNLFSGTWYECFLEVET